MNRAILLSALLCCLLTPTALRAASAQEPTEPSWERYQVLIERNIFSRVRGRRPEPAPSVRPEAPSAPQRYLILTGTVHTADTWVAFIEDARTGETHIYRRGDSIPQGRIADINLDGLTYRSGETELTIHVGDYVGGAVPPSIGASPAPAASGAPVTPSPAPAGAAADLLERLRQRRQKELGR